MKKDPEKKTPQQYAAEISKTWTKSVPSIIDTGILCAEAKTKLKPVDRKLLLDYLKGSMTSGNFSKLVKIGTQSKRLRAIQDKLPPSYTTIYLIAGLQEAQLQGALAEGLIHPNVGREVVQVLAGGKSHASSLLGALYALDECSDQTRLAVTKAIVDLAAEHKDEVKLKGVSVGQPAEQKKAA